MDTVDRVARNVDRTLETERYIRSVNIIIDRLRQVDNVETLLTQQICCFLRSVTAEDHETVQIQLVIILLHCLHLVQTVFVRNTHLLERLAGRSDDRSALCQNTGKICRCQQLIIAVDQSFVTIQKTIDLQLVRIFTESFYDSAHCRVQCLAVTAACQ